jgi:surface-anchored protein
VFVAAVLGCAGPLGLALAPASAAPPLELRPVVLDRGHIDLFELTYDSGAGELDLAVKDETGLYDLGGRFREPDQVSLLVDSDLAAIEVPDSPDYAFLGEPGDVVYYLPVVQAEELPWPGWSTERLNDTLPPGVSVPATDGSVEFEVEVEGPGEVFTFDSGVVGPPIARYVDTTTVEPDVIRTRPDIHNHNDWAFTELGDYELVVTPRVTTSTGTTLTGPAESYHFHVGARPEDLPRKAEAGDLGASLAGVPDSVTDDTEVTLEVGLAEPRPEVAGYSWYLNNDAVGGVTGPELTARVDPFDFVTVTLDDAQGRILSEISASFLPPASPPYAPHDVDARLQGEGGDDVRVTWGSSFDGRSPITRYDVTLSSVAGQTLTRRQADDVHDTQVTFEDVPRGIWRATVSATNELGTGESSEASDPLTVGQASDTAVMSPAVVQVYGAPAAMTVEVSAGATGSVKVGAGDRDVEAVLMGGRATVTLPARALAPGRHALPVTYSGVPGVFNPSVGSAPVTVSKASSTMSVKPITKQVGRGGLAKVRVAVRAPGVTPTGRVEVTVAGRTKGVRLDRRGVAVVKVAVPRSVHAGRRPVKVAYAGDPFVAASTASTAVTVVRPRR